MKSGEMLLDGKKRGYIFTIDAIFSMVLLTTVAFSFLIFTMQPEYAFKTTLVQALARDYARVNGTGYPLDGAKFKAATGINVVDGPSKVPAGVSIVARGSYFYYNSSCPSSSCDPECTITRAEANGTGGSYGCLNNQTFSGGNAYKMEAWVYT